MFDQIADGKGKPYVHEITSNQNLTWSLDESNLKDYLDFLVSEGQINQYEVTDRNYPKAPVCQFFE